MALKKPSDLFNKKESSGVFDRLEVSMDISETYDRFRDNLDRVNVLSEKVEELSNQLSQKLDRDDLENAMLSQLMILDENFKSFQNQIKGLNKEDLKEFKSTVLSLTEIVEELFEKELPRYKKQVTNTDIRIGEKFDDLKKEVKENIISIKEDVDSKVENIAEVIDNNLEYFNRQLEETSLEVKENIKETKDSYHKLYDLQNKLETSVDLSLDDYRKELSVAKADILINDQHIKNVDRYIQEYHQELIELKEEVFDELEKLPVGNIQENIKRLEKKIDYIKETYSRIEPEVIVKEVIKEGLLNEPPETQNTDSLTPLNKNFVTLDQLQEHYRLFINRIQQQLSTLGGGGETRLEFLDDVDRNSVNQNGYVLQYNSAQGKFIGTSYISGSGIGSFTQLQVAGVSTFTAGPVLIGSGTSTGTATQRLQVTGGGYVSGNLGIGTTNPIQKVEVISTDTDIVRIRGASSGVRFQSNPSSMDIISHNGSDTGTRNLFIRQYSQSVGILLDTNNNVGIGTTNPLALLQVGAGTSAVVVTGIGSVGIGTTTPGAMLNVNAPSAFVGNLLDLQVNGTRQVSANSSGVIRLKQLQASSAVSNACSAVNLDYFGTGNAVGVAFGREDGTYYAALGQFSFGAPTWAFSSTLLLSWTNGTATGGTADLTITRDAANTLAQRNGTNAQVFRVYNTYTSASQYERAYLGWNNNIFQIGVDTAGISTARQMEFQTDGITRVAISTIGSVGIGTTTPTSTLQVIGDARIGINTSQGIILTSPNGTRYRLIVDNSGVISTVLAP